MSDNPWVTISRDTRGVATITLDRRDCHNAFDDRVIEGLYDAIDIAIADDVRLLLLRSQGKHFSSGADLNWMARCADLSEADNRRDAERLAALMDRLYKCPVPTIARVQGAAYGGALGLICCCDIAIAAADTQLCLSEVKLGLIPAVIGPYVVEAIGKRQARRYFLSAEAIDANTALDLNLVHQVVDTDQLDNACEAMIACLLSRGPQALRRAKALLHHLQDGPTETVRQETAAMIAATRASDEGRQGVAAFLAHRTAPWRLTEQEQDSNPSPQNKRKLPG